MKNYIITSKYPSAAYNQPYREALPSGNGSTGILVEGFLKKEKILFNNGRLWHRGICNDIPDVSYTLEKTRELIDKGDYFTANTLTSAELRSKNYCSTLAHPLPVVELTMDFAINCSFSDYHRSLNMQTGEITVGCEYTIGKMSRKTFVSRKDDVVVTKISAEFPLKYFATLDFFNSLTGSAHRKYNEIKDSLEVRIENNYLIFRAKNEDGKHYGAVCKIITDGDIKNINGKAQVTQNTESMLIVKTFCDDQEASEIINQIDKVSTNYETLLDRHLELHKEMFMRSQVNFSETDNNVNEQLLFDAYDGQSSNELLNKLWNYGRFLLICSTGENQLPTPIFGLWHYDYELIWSQYMANINLQMTYWQAPQTGLFELLKSMIDYYISQTDYFVDASKKIFGIDGIYVSAGITPGVSNPNQTNYPVITNWISGAGWICQHFYDYYLYTNDTQYFEEKILPFMLKTADFYLEYITYDQNGNMKIYPSVSPENTPSNFIPENKEEDMGHIMPSAVNATMDFSVMKELFANIVDYCSANPKYQDLVKKYQDTLAKIPDYQINKDGAVREWMDDKFDDNYNHRHLSHLYSVYPGKETISRNDKKLIDAFEKAVDLRNLDFLSGWSYSYIAGLYSRLRKPNKALKYLDNLVKSCMLPNLMTLHNDWRNMGISCDLPFSLIQLDANFGLVSAINEMLLYTDTKKLEILPALPERFKKGNFEKLCFYFGTVDCSWSEEENCIKAVINPNKDAKIELTVRGVSVGELALVKNQSVSITADFSGNNITVK